MKNVIIFTYYWPPASSPGVWRYLKFTKFLPEFGWNPIIITVDESASPSLDETLDKEVPEGIQVYKTRCIDPYMLYNKLQGKKGKQIPEAMAGVKNSKSLFQKVSKYFRANFFVPDPKIGWVRFAVKKAERIIESQKIDAIITTGPPNSTYLIGLKLKRKHNIPWLIDFRDPWTSNYFNTEFLKRNLIAKKVDTYFEDRALKHADFVVGISDGILNEYKSRSKKSAVIYNGYDNEDFTDKTKTNTDLFRLSYIGSLKPNMDIDSLWQAIQILRNENQQFKDLFRLRFVGNINPEIMSKLEALDLSSCIELRGFVPHHISISEMQDSNVLLFIIPRSAYSKSITSGKVFEYMASKTPMLSIGPVDGIASEIVTKGGRSKMIDYDDFETIKTELLKYFEEWLNNEKLLPSSTGHGYEDYSRKNQTRQLAEYLTEISN